MYYLRISAYNTHIHVGDIPGILMMYSMFGYDNPELRYHCFSRTAPYHAIVYP